MISRRCRRKSTSAVELDDLEATLAEPKGDGLLVAPVTGMAFDTDRHRFSNRNAQPRILPVSLAAFFYQEPRQTLHDRVVSQLIADLPVLGAFELLPRRSARRKKHSQYNQSP